MSSGLNLAAVVFGTLASFTAFLIAVVQMFRILRKRWIEDAKNTQAVIANTKAVQDLTRIVSGQSAQIQDMSDRLTTVETQVRR